MPNLKRFTLEKRDKRKKTGESRGSAIRWLETDSGRFGHKSVPTRQAVVGLQITEAWQQESAKENVSPLPTGDTASCFWCFWEREYKTKTEIDKGQGE